MADKGAVGKYVTKPASIVAPRERLRQGQLTISGTAQLDEVAGPAVVWLFGQRGILPLLAVQASASGAFTARNLAAGRYVLIVHGQQVFLPAVYAVDVS